jgi:hypothetical protein
MVTRGFTGHQSRPELSSRIPPGQPPVHFISAYNFGRRLKTLKGLTLYEAICKAWATQPERFKLDPLQQMPGLNI